MTELAQPATFSKHIIPDIIPQLLKEWNAKKEGRFRLLNLRFSNEWFDYWITQSELNSILDGTYTPNEKHLSIVINFFKVFKEIPNENSKYFNILFFLENYQKISNFFKYKLFSYNKNFIKCDIPITIHNEFNISEIIVHRCVNNVIYCSNDSIEWLIIYFISKDYIKISGRFLAYDKQTFNVFINAKEFQSLIEENFQ
jgi:hypothetical protein